MIAIALLAVSIAGVCALVHAYRSEMKYARQTRRVAR